jgi:hypothetical protein
MKKPGSITFPGFFYDRGLSQKPESALLADDAKIAGSRSSPGSETGCTR